MNDIKDILREIKDSKRSALTISKELDINKDKLYSWLTGKATPKHLDSVKLQKWYLKELRDIKYNEKQIERHPTMDFGVNEDPYLYLKNERIDKQEEIIDKLQNTIDQNGKVIQYLMAEVERLKAESEANAREGPMTELGKTGGRRS